MDSGRLLRALCVGAALLPFLAAVAAHCAGPVPRPAAVANDIPGLAFSQYLVDLGEVSPSELVFAYFEFRNTGETTVQNIKLEPSCGCLQPHLARQHYLPGERGSFRLDVQTANQPAGPKEYRVKVKYNDPHPRETEVVFRVTLPVYKVFVMPRALQVYDSGSGQSMEHKIEIIDRRPEPLTVKRVDCSRTQLAHVAVTRTEVDAEGHTHIYLTATTPADLPPGRHEGLIRIFTEDPDYRSLRVPLRVISERKTSRLDPQVQQAGAMAAPHPHSDVIHANGEAN